MLAQAEAKPTEGRQTEPLFNGSESPDIAGIFPLLFYVGPAAEPDQKDAIAFLMEGNAAV
ncbi:hypothetical protein A5906_39680 [Bradyrhizobium sacchari]|nr:hypothetical protein A5906_39680 [Bradyrhizobium sacchari]